MNLLADGKARVRGQFAPAARRVVTDDGIGGRLGPGGHARSHWRAQVLRLLVDRFPGQKTRLHKKRFQAAEPATVIAVL